MPYRTWLLVFAIGLILYAPLGQAQEQEQESEGHAETQQEQSPLLTLPISVKIIESAAESDARQRHQEESRQREIKNLIAQQGINAATQTMSRATLDMRDFARKSTVLAAFGTLFLFGTLYFTYRSIKITREIGNKQIRAYLGFGKCVLDQENKAGPCLTIKIKNSGNSPATVKRWAYKLTFLDRDGFYTKGSPVFLEECFPISPGAKMPFHFSLSSSGHIKFAEGFGDVPIEELAIHMQVSITYTDVFEETHDVYAFIRRDRSSKSLDFVQATKEDREQPWYDESLAKGSHSSTFGAFAT